MACNNIIHELFVSVQKTLHERFAIIEEVIKIETSKLETEATSVNTDFANLSNQVKSLSENVADITRTLKELSDKFDKTYSHDKGETIHVTKFDSESLTPKQMSRNLNYGFIEPIHGIEIYKNQICESVANEECSNISYKGDEDEEEVVEEEVVEEEVVEEEVVEEEVVEEEVEEEVVEEEVVEEDSSELEEFPYKGKMYYKDSDNIIYKLSDDGEPSPIGKYDPLMKRVSKL